MKKLVYFLFLGVALSLVACNDTEDEETKPENNFTVSGKIQGAENQMLYVEAPSDRGTIPVASAKINSAGTFELNGNVPGLGFYLLRVGPDQTHSIPCTFEPGDKLKINAKFEEIGLNPNASGTKWAPVMNKYLKELKKFQEAQDRLKAQESQFSMEELNAKYYLEKEKLDAFVRNSMTKSPDNPYNIVLSMVLLPTTSFDDWKKENLSVMEEVAQAYEKKYSGQQAAQTFRSQVDQLATAYSEYEAVNSGTIAAPEIALNSPDGKTIKLSDLRGKIVLIDFWASWCGPCRKESPNVVKMYKKYQSKGFTVLSVSLDEDINAWKGAIQKDGLIWPNHVSDLKGWNSAMPSLYGFEAIPFTVLVNREGKIIGKELRGEKLEQKLEQVFKNE